MKESVVRVTVGVIGRLRSAGRWYAESCSHVDPAVALGMFGTGLVAIPVDPAPGAAERPSQAA